MRDGARSVWIVDAGRTRLSLFLHRHHSVMAGLDSLLAVHGEPGAARPLSPCRPSVIPPSCPDSIRASTAAASPGRPPCRRSGRMDGRIESGHDGVAAAVEKRGDPAAATAPGRPPRGGTVWLALPVRLSADFTGALVGTLSADLTKDDEE